MTYVLERFDVDDVHALTAELRALPPTGGIDHEAQALCRHLHSVFVDDAGAPAAALVRIYKTERFERLDPELKEFVAALAGGEQAPGVRCLTLLGTAGDLPEWNDRSQSEGHRAIPLPTPEFVERLPMIDQLIRQLGIDVAKVVEEPTQEEARQLAARASNVFHVEQAVGSPFIPAQDFVAAHGVRSAVGFGGIMLSGDFFAAILFAKVPISDPVARTLKILAHPIRLRFLPFAAGLTARR